MQKKYNKIPQIITNYISLVQVGNLFVIPCCRKFQEKSFLDRRHYFLLEPKFQNFRCRSSFIAWNNLYLGNIHKGDLVKSSVLFFIIFPLIIGNQERKFQTHLLSTQLVISPELFFSLSKKVFRNFIMWLKVLFMSAKLWIVCKFKRMYNSVELPCVIYNICCNQVAFCERFFCNLS